MAIKIEASQRLKAAKLGGYDAEVLDLRVTGTPEALKTLTNLLAAIQWNTNVGHSCKVAAYFDGDGADKIRIDGLPDNLGADMAEAASSYGDGFMMEISAEKAWGHNYSFQEGDDHGNMAPIVTATLAYPKEEDDED
jgi:hypothetical protein